MWVRGLKPPVRLLYSLGHAVAPYVGAWIETIYLTYADKDNLVAPYVGAWIETKEDPKPVMTREVAPYVGAWIETTRNPLCLAAR